MAAPTDKVRPLVQESAFTGGDPADEVEYPEPLNPNEDGMEAQGMFYQPPSPSTTRDKTTYHTRDDQDNLVSKDQQVETEVRLLDEVFIRLEQDRNVTIPSGFCWLRRNLRIAAGVNITIKSGAELKII